MRCPSCGSQETFTINSRPDVDDYSRRRRYECPGCGSRFSTKEFLICEESKEMLSKLKSLTEELFCDGSSLSTPHRIRLPEERKIEYVQCLGCNGTGEYNGTDIISNRLVVLKCGVCNGTGKMPI